MSQWSESGTWEGEHLRREAFFFSSSGVELFGSLYVAKEVSCPLGVVCCNSWGVEADRADPLQRAIALRMARLGGAGFLFHYPGYGDSYGELADLDLATLEVASIDAVKEASRRCPEVSWALAGFMLGASFACLAQREAGVDRLLLIQPALQPGSYFRWLAGRTKPLAPGPSPREMLSAGTTPWMAYGYPIPRAIAEHDAEADLAASEAVDAFGGEATIIHMERPEADRWPDRFNRVEVPGTWRFGSLEHSGLAAASIEWFDRSAKND